MHAVDMARYLHRMATLSIADFKIPVKVLNVRTVWGKDQFMITPVDGTGEAWVESYRLTFVAEVRRQVS